MRNRSWSLAIALLVTAFLGRASADTPAKTTDSSTPVQKASLANLPQPRGTPEESAACMSCHEDHKMEVDMDNEETKSLFVDKEVLGRSVHAKLECTDCHRDLKGKGDGHSGPTFASARKFSLTFSEQCKHCHFANYTKTLDSVHHAIQAKGDEKAAVCTDCHGAHDVGKADEPRSRISKSCAPCHQKISKEYAASVHGKPLFAEENADVPTCTDCHRAHDINNPKTASWRLRMPQLCGNCHSDEKVMSKYHLSTKVLSTYLDDFHGTTASLELAEKNAEPIGALCTDCHGVHDIAKADDPKSTVMQDNINKTCQRCHEGAPKSFSRAWLSHYEPSLTKAPFVFLIKLFYTCLIPFMIGGLLLQIFLHLWRVVVNR